jgi:hypothetical protein
MFEKARRKIADGDIVETLASVTARQHAAHIDVHRDSRGWRFEIRLG